MPCDKEVIKEEDLGQRRLTQREVRPTDGKVEKYPDYPDIRSSLGLPLPRNPQEALMSQWWRYRDRPKPISKACPNDGNKMFAINTAEDPGHLQEAHGSGSREHIPFLVISRAMSNVRPNLKRRRLECAILQ